MRFALLLLCPLALFAEKKSEAQKLYEANCYACHNPKKMIAGPTLYEIHQLYKGKPEGIVAWAKKPGRKRLEGIAMPAMAHLGDETLAKISKYMLEAGSEISAKSVRNSNPIKEELGRVQRSFMPNSGVISFVVRFSDKLSLCWDAEKTATRYVWRGFIDPRSQFTSNGSTLPKVEGDKIYESSQSPFLNIKDPVKFLGYNINSEGLPEFLYKRGDYSFSENYSFKDQQITITYSVSGPSGLEYKLPKIKGFKTASSTGEKKGSTLHLSKDQMKQFTITLTEEKK